MQDSLKRIIIAHQDIVLLIIVLWQEEVRDVDNQDFVSKRKEVLKNRLYGLLCEKEKDGSWEEFLDNILIDLNTNEERSYEYYVLVTKISKCRYLSYKYFRKTIFECMNLIDGIDVI